MALLFMDSFDHYVTADLTEKWTTMNACTISAGNGRRASASMRTSNQNTAYLFKGLTTSGATGILGFAMKVNSIPATMRFASFYDGALTKDQVYLQLNTDGSLVAFRGGNAGTPMQNGGTQLGAPSAAGVISASVTAYIELKVLLSDTVGTVTVRVNGIPVLSLTGQDTSNGSLVWSGAALASNTSGNLVVDFDDLYVCDGSGAAPWNDFLGDCRVDARLPTAAGATTGWTPLAGANWDAVNDAAPDDDTTYVSTSTVGVTDTFVTQDVAVSGATIFGVQHCLNLKKMDAGVCTVAPVIRHSGVDYPGAAISPGTTYAFGLAIAQTNPGTGAAWTEADYNAAEFGYKRVS